VKSSTALARHASTSLELTRAPNATASANARDASTLAVSSIEDDAETSLGRVRARARRVAMPTGRTVDAR
jgi:hypothetical protein